MKENKQREYGKMFKVRTDLALENQEQLRQEDSKMQGIMVEESVEEALHLHTTIVKIVSEKGAQSLGKPQGTYITMETQRLLGSDATFHHAFSKKLALHLRTLIGDKQSILVVGLGNREITPDSLGPRVIQNLQVNRHFAEEKDQLVLSGLAPGVMAQTGMETMEIIRGVVEMTKPDIVMAVDALAARSMSRVNTTIQLTDTGINPGSGVMNNRHGLNKETLGVPVIGIGVPTVVDAASIVHDAVVPFLEGLDVETREELLEDVLTPELRYMFVTPKDIDEVVAGIGQTIAEALNHLILPKMG